MMSTTSTHAADSSAPQRLLSRDFLAICVGQFFGFTAQGLANPIFPLYMVAQGQTETYIGFALAAFNVISFVVRPTFGGMVDAGQPRKAMSVAGAFMALGPLGYLVPNPWLVFAVRGVHGVGWAGVNVSGSAWVAYLAPANRRAEALGYYTMAQRVGNFAGPVVGLWLANNVGFNEAFLASGFCGLCVLLTSLAARSGAVTAATPGKAADEPQRSWLLRWVEPGAFLGASLLVLNTIPGVVVVAYMPLYYLKIGLGGIELYFVVLGIMGIFARGLIGRWADKIGRMRAIGSGFLIQFIGLSAFTLTQDPLLLMLGGAVWIFGSGLSQPSLYALAIDRAPPNRRGKAMATYTMAFQVGGGIGAITGGVILEQLGFPALHLAMAGTALAGVLIVVFGVRGKLRPVASPT
ncbi:MAG: MFS transporter [Dehalococcoidia bacterium]|nr:MFS transporter [Dehalococcoidia bacterium]